MKYKITVKIKTIQSNVYTPQKPEEAEVTLEVNTDLILKLTDTIATTTNKMLGKHVTLVSIDEIKL